MIDKIYLLHHPDVKFKKRFEYISNRLNDEKLQFEVIDSHHPHEIDYDNLMIDYEKTQSLTIEQIKGYSYQNFYKKISKESLSLILKHLECWKHQIEENFEYVLVFEDDCEIPENFSQTLENIMTEIHNKNCELVMIGTAFDFVSPNKIEGEKIHYHPFQKTRCTHCYIMNKTCAEKMIDGFKNFNLPIDFKMNEIIQYEKIQVYWYEPGLKQKES
jgi:GR25 family glycosyltransferase involved in LPS biosynthesis